MNKISIERMEDEARARIAAVDGRGHALGCADAHATTRGGTPHMPRMADDGGGAATTDTYGMHATDTTHEQHAAPPKPTPPTQRHQDNDAAAIGTGTHQRVHFGDSRLDDGRGQPAGGETAAALHDSAQAANELQHQQAIT